MNLLEDNFNFELNFVGDGVEFFDYNFTLSSKYEERTFKNVNNLQLNTLRENCKKILEVTEYVNMENLF